MMCRLWENYSECDLEVRMLTYFSDFGFYFATYACRMVPWFMGREIVTHLPSVVPH